MTTVPDISREFSGQVAVVTGGGSGIGRAIAERYSAAGGKAIVLGRREAPLRETVDRITSTGGVADFACCDMRDATLVFKTIADIVEREGRIDALVNNAAGNFVSPAESLSPNGWKAVIDIVLNGSFYAARAAAPHMLAAGSGSILNVIATYAWHGHPGTVHSAAANGGLVAMTRTLAVEWAGRGIRVNAIAPGPTETEGAGAALWGTDEARARVQYGVPADRFASPEEIAESASYLLSGRASYVTGEVLVVDGGQWLGKSIYTDARARS